MRLLAPLASTLIFASVSFAADVTTAVSALMNNEVELKGVPFSEVVQAASGKRVLSLSSTNVADRELVAKLGRALDEALRKLNAAGSPIRQKRRINEVSTLFESAIKSELNAMEGLDCDFPKTAAGTYQRSGYPDLRVVEKKTKRVIYLDPKLFERGSRASSLRTFYFEPKKETGKILDDAHHLIVGFEHDGKVGEWKFLSWELVDLANFRVRLKAEFQASNRDLYRPEAIIARSGTNSTAEAHRSRE